MNHPITKSSLSDAQRALVELLQRLNFGRIEGLHIQGGEPTFHPAPRIIQKLKMGGDNSARPEADLPDFFLKRPAVEMLETILKVGDGKILSIEVRGGLPTSLELEQSPEGAGGSTRA